MNLETRRTTTAKVLITTLVIVASMVVGGAFLGFSLAAWFGTSKAILGATLATAGLFISLPIAVKVVDRMIRRNRSSGKGTGH